MVDGEAIALPIHSAPVNNVVFKRGERQFKDICSHEAAEAVRGIKCCSKKDVDNNPAYCLLNVDIPTIIQQRKNIWLEENGTRCPRGKVTNNIIDELDRIMTVTVGEYIDGDGLKAMLPPKYDFPYKLSYDTGRKTADGDSVLDVKEVCGEAFASAIGIGRNTRTKYEGIARNNRQNIPQAPTNRTMK